MTKKAAVLLLGLLACAARPAAAVDDVMVGDPAVPYGDPEFWCGGLKAAWSDSATVWLADVSPVDGSLYPPDGRGRALGAGTAPEWGFCASGPAVFFTGCARGGQIFRARIGPVAEAAEQLTEGGVNAVPFASTDVADPAIGVLCATSLSNLWRWFRDDAPATDGTLECIVSAPRWIPGEDAAVTTAEDGPTVQIARYDMATGLTELLTRRPGNRFDAIFFNAPELGGEQLFLCTADKSSVEVYRRGGSGWVLMSRLAVPVAPPPGVALEHASPEPFVFNGTTYISLAVTEGSYTGGDPGTIWVTDLAGTFYQRVSDDAPSPRLDPETFVSDGQVWVYYYTSYRWQEGTSRLRRCRAVLPGSGGMLIASVVLPDRADGAGVSAAVRVDGGPLGRAATAAAGDGAVIMVGLPREGTHTVAVRPQGYDEQTLVVASDGPRTVSAAFPPFTPTRGDLDADGRIDITDVLRCLRAVVGLAAADPARADFNADGRVDIADALLIALASSSPPGSDLHF